MIDVDKQNNDLDLNIKIASNLIGKGVKHLRRKHNISQQELEYFSGVQQSVISNVENGNFDIRLEQLVRLSQSFHLNLVAFIDVCRVVS